VRPDAHEIEGDGLAPPASAVHGRFELTDLPPQGRDGRGTGCARSRPRPE
jgi:hypothetical protein